MLCWAPSSGRSRLLGRVGYCRAPNHLREQGWVVKLQAGRAPCANEGPRVPVRRLGESSSDAPPHSCRQRALGTSWSLCFQFDQILPRLGRTKGRCGGRLAPVALGDLTNHHALSSSITCGDAPAPIVKCDLGNSLDQLKGSARLAASFRRWVRVRIVIAELPRQAVRSSMATYSNPL
jgi:hypothetical protein